MQKKLRIYNTFGYSIKELENLKENPKNIKIETVYKQVSNWSFFEKVEYLTELNELYKFIEKTGFDIFSKDDKKKIVMEIKKYIKTDDGRLAEDYLWALKKEIDDGALLDFK